MSSSSIRPRRVLWCATLTLSLAACGGSPTPEAGVDAPILDMARSDTAVVDAMPADAALVDSVLVDNVLVDNAVVEAAVPDASSLDASGDVAPADAAPVDAAATEVVAPNPAPSLLALSPASVTAGASGFTLTLRGANFLPSSTVTWAGAARASTFVSATTLQLNVPAADVASAGAYAVVVTNPSPGGGAATASFAVHARMETSTWLAGSTFRSSAGWFDAGAQDRVWLADLDADHLDDVVGLDALGNVWVSRGTGTGFAPSVMLPTQTTFRVSGGWFQSDSRQRVWFTDVTGDGRADLVGVDFAGGIWVSESTAAGFNASRMVGTSSFASAANYFAGTDHPHVFLGDMNADGKTDLVGIDPATGRIGIVLASGSGTTASFSAESAPVASSVFTNPALWFVTTTAQRVFLGDLTGDRRADLVAFANNGDLWVAEATPTGINVPHRIGNTVFSDANGWFATPTQPRLSLADFNGDGRLDVVGIGGPAVGDGDLWALESTGSGSTADAYQHVLLDDSAFRTADGWFGATSRQSVWVTDVTGDGRADVLGVDAMGGVWVSRSVGEVPSPGVTPAQSHDYFLPAVRNGDSGFVAATYFSSSSPRRVWLGDVTGDGARDLVAVSGAAGTDGDLQWRMAAPAMVRSLGVVTRQMLTSGTAQRIEVALTRRVAASSFDAGALELALDGVRVLPTGVTTTPRGATFDVLFPAPASAETRLDLALAARATDAWGHALDGDGDGRPGGVAARPTRWSSTLVAGAARVSLMPDDATGVPRYSGFYYCPRTDAPATASGGNPIEARILVLAGGGACSTSSACATGQSCVAGVCQGADGVDANQPLVVVSLDLVGVNPGRLPELLARRFGIPRQNVILSATHVHAAFRTIHLFDAPYFDDRHSGVGPYQSLLEDRVADGVGAALADLTPVEIATGSAVTTGLNLNRRFGVAPSAEIRTVTAVELRTPGASPRTRAVLVNYALHPVIMFGAAGINADYPGYLRQNLEGSRCAAGDTGCATLFLQAGAGDINPVSGVGSDDIALARSVGNELARLVDALPRTFASTAGAQLRVQQRISNFAGNSACNTCRVDRVNAPTVWSARATAVSVGVPGATALFRFGTLPAEPFSALQSALMAGLTPAPMLLGYANGYFGYFPNHEAVGDGAPVAEFRNYGIVACDGPSFFTSSAAAPTTGDQLVAQLRSAFMNDLR